MEESRPKNLHNDLVERAVRWLYGTKRCNIVLSGHASCREIPDAVGWCTSYKSSGSILVECKTSMSDFHADKRKDHDTRMGTWRYFLCPVNLIPDSSIEKHYPDHGLLYLDRNRVYVIREAPERRNVNLQAEIRLLQFALVHAHDNLLDLGCTVNMLRLTKFRTADGINFPNGHRND